ncbi:MAG TPA: ABC transporter permease [Gemmatimonadaceae bacterium]|nr:ABC transporter permease [Gemmatimonadaceae bacterium]
MRLLKILRRRAHERDMDDEMRFHVDMEAADLERMGVPPAEARRRALAAFGGIQRYKEEGHESRGDSWLADLMRDLRYAARSLRRAPSYTAVVVLTLALGIAANTSIFSVANGILFKPLPYREPGKLVVVSDGLEMIGAPEALVTGPEVVRLRAETRSFEGFAILRGGSAAVSASDGGEPQQVTANAVSVNFFQLLGVGPDVGRGFTAGEDAVGVAPVAVISRRLWMQRYGADRSLVGRQILVDGRLTTLVGVLPADFRYTAQQYTSESADVFVPYADTLQRMPVTNHSLGVLARIRSDVPAARAVDELKAVARRLDREVYRSRGFDFKAITLQELMVRQVRPALVVLLVAVGVLILIMCANLAVLVLVRTSMRERELSVRRAIGASNGRVTRQILTEMLMLSVGGGVTGALLGTWALKALLALAPGALPRRAEIGIDVTVLAVTLLVSLVVGVVIGLAPVVHSARSDIANVLREKAPSRSGNALRRGLVLLQLALSMVLLAGTGLLLGSFVRLTRVDPGFNPDHVLAIELMASRSKYGSGQPVANLITRYAEALRSTPGVTAVGASTAPPFLGMQDQNGFSVPRSPTNTGDPQKDFVLVDAGGVSPGWMQAAGVTLVEGQEFGPEHTDSASARVVIIDDLLARRYFPQGGAVGQMANVNGDMLRVLGVARHVRMGDLREAGREQVWVPHAYRAYRYVWIAVRVDGTCAGAASAGCDPLRLVPAMRQAIRGVDADQPIVSVSRMSDTVRDSLAERRLVLILVGGFAGAALLLAALGVYGVTASAVTQRTRELGIRMALGANRPAVIWSVLSAPAVLVGAGLVLGLAGTFVLGRALERLLYGVRPTDPLTLGLVALVLLVVALIASWVPARRATRVDPMVALRAE